MARPIRIEYKGAVYHVTIRGNERKSLFKTDADWATQGAKGLSYARIRDISRTEAQSPRRLATAGCLGFDFCVSPLLRILRQHSKTRLSLPIFPETEKVLPQAYLSRHPSSKEVTVIKLA